MVFWTVSDFVRQVLFIHLYGRYDMFGLSERKMPESGNPEMREPCAKPKGKDSGNPPPEMSSATNGNKVIPLKINLPAMMKLDLKEVAEKKHRDISRLFTAGTYFSSVGVPIPVGAFSLPLVIIMAVFQATKVFY